jgi:hypothetical protein
MTKKWHAKAQAELERMLRSVDFDVNDAPRKVHASSPVFAEFKLDNFRTHFNRAKAKMGLQCTDAISPYLPWLMYYIIIVKRPRQVDDEQLADLMEPSPSKAKRGPDDGEDTCDVDTAVVFTNQPCNVAVYSNPETMRREVVACVVLPSGVGEVEISVDESGDHVAVSYLWPAAMLLVTSLFQAEIDSRQIVSYHPKIVALREQLVNHTTCVDTRPVGKIVINLPTKVEYGAPEKQEVVGCDKGYILVMTFKAVESAFTVAKAASKISNFLK